MSSTFLAPVLKVYQFARTNFAFLKKVPYLKKAIRRLRAKVEEKTLYKYHPPLPMSIVIDPSSICNLACPLCPTGAGTADIKAGVLTFEKFKNILDQFDNLVQVFLYNWGEPFLNKDIFKIIALTKERNIKTCMDSNFSLVRDDKFFENLVSSGLTKLRVSCDGASQESYEKYRIGGNFELVYNNMKKLRAAQKRLGHKEPHIIWKFLVTRHNEQEVEKAKMMAKAIDVEINFEPFLLTDVLPDEQVIGGSIKDQEEDWLPTSEKYLWEFYSDYYKKKKKQYPIIDAPCPWLFDYMAVNTDGTVLPCCYASKQTSAFGNVFETSVKEIWNSDKYLHARSLFLEEEYNGPKPKVICESCPMYRQVNTLVQIQAGLASNSKKFSSINQ